MEIGKGMKLLAKFTGSILIVCTLISVSCNTFATHKKNLKKSKHAKVTHVVSSAIYGSQNLTNIINHSIDEVDPSLNIGVAIKSMKTGETLYTRNASLSLVPASILKIFTAESALLFLGPQFKFKTSFYTDATEFKEGVIKGNVYLVHSGDPTLAYKDLIALMDELKSHQVQRIDGNIYIDMSAYDQAIYGPGWIWDDTQYCYGAPISASIINHNCLSFSVSPGKAVGNPATILESPHFFYSIQNGVVTKPASARSCTLRLGTNPDSSISVSGCMPRGRYAQGLTTIISDTVAYNKAMLRALFSRSGIEIRGNIMEGSAPTNVSVMVTHESKSLTDLISTMLKKSDNIIAGSLFKKIGEIYFKQPGSWENGSLAVSKILTEKAGVDCTGMSVLDGSGLSRYNHISPAQMLKVLDFAYHHNGTNYEFISGLPVAGVDGTLKHRLSNIAWKVRAKTGTMSGVNALAGYVITDEKEPLAFVIIVNGHLGMGWQYKELEDKIVTYMSRYAKNKI